MPIKGCWVFLNFFYFCTVFTKLTIAKFYVKCIQTSHPPSVSAFLDQVANSNLFSMKNQFLFSVPFEYLLFLYYITLHIKYEIIQYLFSFYLPSPWYSPLYICTTVSLLRYLFLDTWAVSRFALLCISIGWTSLENRMYIYSKTKTFDPLWKLCSKFLEKCPYVFQRKWTSGPRVD